MKLILTILLIYLAYRFLFERPWFLRFPGRSPEHDQVRQQPEKESSRSAPKDDYIDYEEIP